MVTTVLGIVICRVGAVLLFVEAARSLQFVLPALLEFSGDKTVPLVWLVLTTIVPAATGVALWFFAERICHVRIDSARVEIKSSLDSLDFIGIGTLLMGLYAMLSGAIDALTTEATISVQRTQLAATPGILADDRSYRVSARVSYAAQILLGALLVVGRLRIARLLATVRHLGAGKRGQVHDP